MSKLRQAVQALVAIVAAGAFAFGVWGVAGLNHHLIVALDKWGDGGIATQAAAKELSATLQVVNAPCVGLHGSVSCGPLAQMSQTEKNIGIVAAQSALQVKQTGALVAAAAASVQQASGDIHAVAQSASKTMDGLTADETRLLPVMDGLPPLEHSLASTSDASTAAVNSLNARLTDPRVDALLTDFRSMADNGAAITADGRKVADYGTAQLTAKKTFLQRVEGYSGDLFDITAYLARHYR